MTTMKRRALGRGLGSLIPAAPPVASATRAIASTAPKNPEPNRLDSIDNKPAITMSAADIADQGVNVPIQTAIFPDARQIGDVVREIPLDAVVSNPEQPRHVVSEEQLEELAASIRTNGILQPILVRPWGEKFQLVAGERRLRAARKVGFESVPAIVRSIPDDKLLEIALVENIQRQELNPIEEARAYLTLQKQSGASQAQVAERVGKQPSTVANIVRLLRLPLTVQQRVESGGLAMGHARALLGLVDPKAQENAANTIEKRGMSVRQAEELVRRLLRPPAEPAPAGIHRDANLLDAEEQLARRLGTKVRILQGPTGRGRMVLEFYSGEELDRLYERIIRS